MILNSSCGEEFLFDSCGALIDPRRNDTRSVNGNVGRCHCIDCSHRNDEKGFSQKSRANFGESL